MWKWVLGVCAVLAICVFLLMEVLKTPPDSLDLARSKTTANGLYVVSVAPEAEPVERGTLHAWVATIATPGGDPVSDATLAIDGGMPGHGHGLPTAPQASGHQGEGRYRIEGVRFNMGGLWVLRLTVSSPAGDDTAEFNINL